MCHLNYALFQIRVRLFSRGNIHQSRCKGKTLRLALVNNLKCAIQIATMVTVATNKDGLSAVSESESLTVNSMPFSLEGPKTEGIKENRQSLVMNTGCRRDVGLIEGNGIAPPFRSFRNNLFLPLFFPRGSRRIGRGNLRENFSKGKYSKNGSELAVTFYFIM